MTVSKGGRPAIGDQITVTVPKDVLAEIDQQAASAGVKRSDVIREILSRAVTSSPTAHGGSGRLKPAVNVFATWIERGRDIHERRERFKTYRTVAGSPAKLPALLTTVVGELAMNGVPLDEVLIGPSLVAELAGTRASGPEPSWRLRTVLFFEVINELMRRDVKVGPLPDHADRGDAMDFGPTPDDDEYA